MILLIMVAALVVALPLMRKKPVPTFLLYLLFLFFVPYWFGVYVAGQFIPACFALSAIVVLVLVGKARRLALPDILLAILAALVAILTASGRAEPGHALAMLGSWLAPYLIGRNIYAHIPQDRVHAMFAGFGVLLALQAVIEFSLNWHPWVGLSNVGGPGEIWAGIQYRSIFPRSEGAMGHAITMGGAIVMMSPFVLARKWRPLWKTLAVTLVVLGAAVTFSRNALVSLGAVVLLYSFTVGRRHSTAAVRGGYALLVLFFGIAVAPLYLAAIDRGTGVLTASTEYRANYLSLIPDVKFVGLSDAYIQYAPGLYGWYSVLYPGNVVVTLDNTLLLTALQFGWVPSVLLVSVMCVIAARFLRSKSSLPAAAALAQYFTVATVAMITQYPYLWWMMLGMAVHNLYTNADVTRKDRPVVVS